MARTAFLTGVTGQDGSLLADFLLRKGYRVIGMARRVSSPTDWRLEELGLKGDPNFILCSGDLTDQGSMERIIGQYKPDEVYNLGAQSFVGSSWDEAVSTFDITGAGAIRLFDAVRNVHPLAKIYQANSSEMFGGANRVEFLNEKSPFNPQSPYGVAKAAAHYMANVYRVSFGIFISCGVLFNHESEYRGEQFVTRKVTKTAVEISLGLKSELVLHNLDSVRDWGYTVDYIKAMWLMLQQDEPDDFVVATGRTRSIEDLCEVAFAHAGVDNWRSFVRTNKGRPADVRHLRGDASKARRVLSWQPEVEFEEMICRMVDKDFERMKNGICGISECRF